jgi:sodium-independent sulfate anion transporter 11
MFHSKVLTILSTVFGAFFGAYPATGSFSRTAIKAKAGVRTPLAGVITGILVLLAIYLLKAVFYYIPNASLAAVIIHAVGDLITAPSALYTFWRISPLEVVIFFAGVIVTVFTSIEIGIYTTIIASAVLLLWRVAKADGEFLGRLNVRPLDGGNSSNVYLPLEQAQGTNPDIPVEELSPGVFVFRFSSSFLYPNAVHVTDQLTHYLFAKTKRTNPETYGKLGDRPWNDPGPRHVDVHAMREDPRPTLKAIILDFSAVRNIDVSSTQVLVDVRKQLDRHAAPEQVAWHFVSVSSAWTRRALTSAGFGRTVHNGKAVFSVADVGASAGGFSSFVKKETDANTAANAGSASRDIEIAEAGADESISKNGKNIPVLSVDYPAFHLTVDEALNSVLYSLDLLPPPSEGSPAGPSPDGSLKEVRV